MTLLATARDINFISNRDRLRQATRDAHTRAEARWLSPGTFDSRRTYDSWLSALWTVHATLGAAATSKTALINYAKGEQSRREALATDLGVQMTDDLAQKPRSEGWSWGVLYVLHGSALGASMLLKSNAIQSDWPKAYLEEMRWFASSGGLKTFFEQLNAAQARSVDMVRGARDTFDLLSLS